MPSCSHPISRELHKSDWFSFCVLDTMIMEALCKSSICCSNTTRGACLDVKVSAFLFWVYITVACCSFFTSRLCCQTFIISKLNSTTIKDSENSACWVIVLDQISQFEFHLKHCLFRFIIVDNIDLLFILCGSMATTVDHNQVGLACLSMTSARFTKFLITLLECVNIRFRIVDDVLVRNSQALGHLLYHNHISWCGR